MEWFGFWLMWGLIFLGMEIGSGIENGLKGFGRQLRKTVREIARADNAEDKT